MTTTTAPRRRRLDRVRWWTYLLLGVATVVCLFPLYWMFIVATSDTATATRMPPEVVPGDNFLHLAGLVMDTVPFVQSLLNSLFVATAIGVGQAVLCALAGFAFAKLSFPGRNTLFLVVLLTMTVPTQLSVIPQYLIMSWRGWVDTLQALGVPGLVAGVRYIKGDNVDTGRGFEGEEWERDLDIGYVVQSGALKGLNVKLRNVTARSNYRTDVDENRLILSYTLPLW